MSGSRPRGVPDVNGSTPPARRLPACREAGRRCLTLSVFVIALAATPAIAATGDLHQKPGTAGCIISDRLGDQIFADPSCQVGRELRIGGGQPVVAVSPDGRNAYVVGSGSVTIFDRDTATGELTQKAGTASCITPDGMAGDPPVPACATSPALESARAVTVSPDGKNVYVGAGNGIVIFERDTSTGALTQQDASAGCITDDGSPSGDPAVNACQDGTALQRALSVAVSPDGENVYLVAQGSSAVSIFDRDPATGELTQKQGTLGCFSSSAAECALGRMLSSATSVRLSSDGKNVYVTGYYSSGVAVFDRDPATGELTQKAGAAGCISTGGTDSSVYPQIPGLCRAAVGMQYVQDLALSSDGRSVYVTAEGGGVAVLNRDPATGALSQGDGPAVCFSEDGTPEGEGPNRCTLATGLGRFASITISQDGLSVYVVSGRGEYRAGVVAILRRDPATGALTQRAGTAGCVSVDGRGNREDPDTAGACVVGRALAGGTSVTVSPDDRNVYVAGARGGLAIFNRELDVTPPETAITSGPPDGSSTDSASPTFALSASERGSTFACGVDGGAFAACSSPFTTPALSAGRHTFAVRATDIDGNVDSSPASRTFTVTASPPAPPEGAPSGAPSAGAPSTAAAPAQSRPIGSGGDRTAPVVSALGMLPARFAIGSRLPRLVRPAESGPTIRFSLSERATVRLSFARRHFGRRVGEICRRATRALRGRAACTRYLAVRPSVMLRDVRAGVNRVRFEGRLSRARGLAAGRYRVTVIATDAAGNRSAPKHALLTIARRSR